MLPSIKSSVRAKRPPKAGVAGPWAGLICAETHEVPQMVG